MNTESLVWKKQSKELLNNMISKRIRSIIGITMENIEDLADGRKNFSDVRSSVLKVCNDITRKIAEDLEQFTVSKLVYEYKFVSGDRNEG
jgi:hypothetical protein